MGTEKRETDAQEAAENRMKNWPPMVHEAMRLAAEEAKEKGKSEAQVEEEVAKAAGYALKVARDNGLYKENPEDDEDPKAVPLFFQKRKGLDKALLFFKRLEDS